MPNPHKNKIVLFFRHILAHKNEKQSWHEYWLLLYSAFCFAI